MQTVTPGSALSDDLPVARLTRELQALTAVAKILTSRLELPELLQAVMAAVVDVLEPAETGAVMLWDHEAGLFRAAAAFGYDLTLLKTVGLRAGESITGQVFDSGQARLLATPAEAAAAVANMRCANRVAMARALALGPDADAPPRCAVAAPLVMNGEKLGVLVLETWTRPTAFRPADVPFVQTLADLLALAIGQARLAAKADAVRVAREAERLRRELVATLSHELRMPLTAIKGYATALMLKEVDWSAAKHAEFLRLIEAECDNMQGLIREILDSVLLEVHQIRVERRPLDLPALVRQLVDETQRLTQRHRLLTDFPPGFPVLECDARGITQVLRNLLDNAVKYSPNGGLILVRGEVRPRDVVVSLADQGVGIAPEDLIPLFEKYFRAASSGSPYVPGAGLGLPIARAIVEAHGGRIWVESKTGQGTTLYFSLPRPAA